MSTIFVPPNVFFCTISTSWSSSSEARSESESEVLVPVAASGAPIATCVLPFCRLIKCAPGWQQILLKIECCIKKLPRAVESCLRCFYGKAGSSSQFNCTSYIFRLQLNKVLPVLPCISAFAMVLGWVWLPFRPVGQYDRIWQDFQATKIREETLFPFTLGASSLDKIKWSFLCRTFSIFLLKMKSRCLAFLCIASYVSTVDQ